MKIVGVRLNSVGKVYYFDANNVNVSVGKCVIVENDRGLHYGLVDKVIIDQNGDNGVNYNKVIRLTTKSDYKKHLGNLNDSKIALIKCNELVKKYKLNMRIIDAFYTFDREQLVFRFLADERVDFRQLAKDLGGIFKTRIELRQVGIRDKAKEVGGFGPCGRKLCCNNFLTEFDSVSINMAKNQNLSLNPSKINGVCGRLLCCLKYENDSYHEYRKGLPEIGDKVDTDKGEGKVISVDIFERSYRVLLNDNDVISIDVTNDCKE